jgi:outer membrane protein TolC
MKILSLILLATAVTANAQLSLAEKTVLQRHPKILSAVQEASASAARGERAKAAFRPMISLTGVGAVGNDNSIFAAAFEPKNYLMATADPVAMVGLMAMFPIYTGGRNALAASYANSLTAQAASRVATIRLDVVHSLRIALAGFEAAKGKLMAETAGYEAMSELLRVSEARYDAGSAPAVFVLKAKSNLARAELTRVLAEAEVAAASAVVSEAAAGEVAGDWDVELVAPESLESALEASHARPELTALQASLTASRSLAGSARRSANPELNLIGMGTGMASEFQSDVLYKVGLVISLPLIDGGMRRAEAKEAEATALAIENELESMKLQVRKEVTTAWVKWIASPKAVQAADAEVEASSSAYQIAKLRYSEGKAPQTEVELAAADLVAALSDKAEAYAFRRVAWANLMRSIGKNNQEDN